MAHCTECPYPDCIDSCDRLGILEKEEREAKPKLSRKEYMRQYMTGYRERNREDLKEYHRDYMRKRRRNKLLIPTNNRRTL